MTRRARRLAALLPLALLGGCDPSPVSAPEPRTELPRPLTAAERDVIAASNAFAFGLLREVSLEEGGENLLLSPLSASMALGMTMNGARGPTRDAMRRTLGFGTLPLEAVNESYRGLLDLLRGLDPRVDLRVANSVWYRAGFPVEQPFLDTTRRYFDARVAALDFGSPAAPRAINEWVERSTGGMIREMVDGIPADVVMYLMNAVYFRGSWTDRFDPARTRDDTFTTADGSPAPVRMMTREGSYRFLADPAFQMVDLPYGSGAFSMTVLLPAEGRSAAELAASLDDRRWDEAVARLRETRLVLSIPRFRIEYQRALDDALRSLGMEIAFSPDSDFTALSPADPWIDRVFQRSYVRVDEEGTEAAAATSVAVVTSLPPAIRVDRPFLFAIRERLSGTILFLGIVGKPLA